MAASLAALSQPINSGQALGGRVQWRTRPLRIYASVYHVRIMCVSCVYHSWYSVRFVLISRIVVGSHGLARPLIVTVTPGAEKYYVKRFRQSVGR